MAETKEKRERSKAYPGVSLDECIENLTVIKRELGRGAHDRESIGRALGHSGPTGPVNIKVSALVHFGFLDRVGSEYKMTDSALRILNPISDEEKRNEVRAAFLRPKLYQDLMAKFSDDGQIPGQLETHLVRFHGISTSAAKTAAQVFWESGTSAGVFDEYGKLLQTESIDAKKDAGEDEQVEQTEPAKGGQRFIFALTNGRTALLQVPTGLTTNDVNLIRKQVDVLELQAKIMEGSNPAATNTASND